MDRQAWTQLETCRLRARISIDHQGATRERLPRRLGGVRRAAALRGQLSPLLRGTGGSKGDAKPRLGHASRRERNCGNSTWRPQPSIGSGIESSQPRRLASAVCLLTWRPPSTCLPIVPSQRRRIRFCRSCSTPIHLGPVGEDLQHRHPVSAVLAPPTPLGAVMAL